MLELGPTENKMLGMGGDRIIIAFTTFFFLCLICLFFNFLQKLLRYEYEVSLINVREKYTFISWIIYLFVFLFLKF